MSTYIQEIRQALAVTITDDDIKALVDTTRKKALHHTAIAAELGVRPGTNGKAALSLRQNFSLQQMWRTILLGGYNHSQNYGHLEPFISLDTALQWMRIIFSTLDKHFSGEVAEVGKINALHYLNLFVCCEENDNLPPSKKDTPHNDNQFTLSCAAQFLICCSLPAYWINLTMLYAG